MPDQGEVDNKTILWDTRYQALVQEVASALSELRQQETSRRQDLASLTSQRDTIQAYLHIAQAQLPDMRQRLEKLHNKLQVRLQFKLALPAPAKSPKQQPVLKSPQPQAEPARPPLAKPQSQPAPKPSEDAAPPKVRYQRSLEGIIWDTATNLEWYVGADKDVTWGAAKKWVKSLNKKWFRQDFAGGDWCMPMRDKLKGLITETRNSDGLYIDPIFGLKGWWVWTGELYEGNGSCAWGVSFCGGHEYWAARGDSYAGRVFAVRLRRRG